MTEVQYKLIKDSWNTSLVKTSDIGPSFYNRLFYLEPNLRGFFKENIITQSRKFIDALDLVVEALPDWGIIDRKLHDLGSRHSNFAINEMDYVKVREALLYSLKTYFKDSWTTDMEDAWGHLYDRVILSMKEFNTAAQRPSV